MRSLSIILFLFLVSACTVTKKVKTGEMAYRLKQFPLATDLLEEEYKDENDNRARARKAHLLAKSYDMLHEYGEALQWYDVADQLNYNERSDIELAEALKRNERYTDAAQLFIDVYKRTRDLDYKLQSDLCLEAARNMDKEDNSYVIQPISSNSKYSEYSPVFYQNDFLVFSSDKPASTGGKEYAWTGNTFSDLFVMGIKDRKVYNFDPYINTNANEGTAWFNKSYDEIYFTRCYSEDQRDQYCKLYFSMKPNDFWVEPEALPFFDDKTNYGQPTLIENDSVLIFSVCAEDNKTYDLYYSVRVENGWSEADIMPSSINTEGNEKFPTAYKDTLYFASDGLPGYGGLDIFKTYLRSDGSWSRPENMGIPVNGGADDFGLVVDPNFKSNSNVLSQGYFTSSRNTGFGDDIFFFAQYAKEEEDKTDTEEPEVAESEEYNIYLAGRVVEVQYQNDDPNERITGKSPIEASDINISSPDTLLNLKTDKNGRFLLTLNDGNYAIKASKKDFLTNSIRQRINSQNLTGDTTINVEIALDPIIYNQEIILQNIYYDYDKWDIRDDAKPTLDSLYATLDLNPEISIQLSSHTDCRGEIDYNNILSQKRAQSAVDYLKSKGISEGRLMAKGYGKTRLRDNCNCDDCTDEQHQINRRTTFTILK